MKPQCLMCDGTLIVNNRYYCALSCHNAHVDNTKAPKEVKCKQCGIRFVAEKAEHRKYCSGPCARKDTSPSVKREARKLARLALPVAQPCESCGALVNIHRHHKSYQRPIDIKWLCAMCHKATHIPRAENQSVEDFKAMRTSLGLSQRGLARILDTCGQTVSSWECGKSPIPALAVDTMQRIIDNRNPPFELIIARIRKRIG